MVTATDEIQNRSINDSSAGSSPVTRTDYPEPVHRMTNNLMVHQQRLRQPGVGWHAGFQAPQTSSMQMPGQQPVTTADVSGAQNNGTAQSSALTGIQNGVAQPAPRRSMWREPAVREAGSAFPGTQNGKTQEAGQQRSSNSTQVVRDAHNKDYRPSMYDTLIAGTNNAGKQLSEGEYAKETLIYSLPL